MTQRPIHTPYLDPGSNKALGLNPIPLDTWIEETADLSKALTYKRDTLASKGREAFRARQSSVVPGTEALLILAKYLTVRYPDAYSLWGDSLAVLSREEMSPVRDTSPLHPLYVASQLTPDDLLILDRRNDQWGITAASLCSPCGWLIGDLVGKPLDEVIRPLTAFAANLSTDFASTLDNLQSDFIAQRFNWRICPSNELFLAGPAKEHAWEEAREFIDQDAQYRLWVRVERQTFRKLPETGAVLVTVRTSMDRLDHVAGFADLRDGLISSLEAMNKPTASFLEMAPFQKALMSYLTSLKLET